MIRASAPRLVLGLLCLLYLLLFVNRVNLSTAAPLIKAEIHLSNSQLGLVFSVFALPYAVFQLLGGWIGDKFGARLILSVCCAVATASTVLTGAVGGFATLFALRVLLGLGLVNIRLRMHRLRNRGAVGPGIGRGVVHTGFRVMQDGLATAHRLDVFADDPESVAALGELL